MDKSNIFLLFLIIIISIILCIERYCSSVTDGGGGGGGSGKGNNRSCSSSGRYRSDSVQPRNRDNSSQPRPQQRGRCIRDRLPGGKFDKTYFTSGYIKGYIDRWNENQQYLKEVFKEVKRKEINKDDYLRYDIKYKNKNPIIFGKTVTSKDLNTIFRILYWYILSQILKTKYKSPANQPKQVGHSKEQHSFSFKVWLA